MCGFNILLSTAPLLGCTGVNSCPFQFRAVARAVLSAAGLSHLHDAGPTPPLAVLEPSLLSQHTLATF
jgi:hypothetical protein